MEAGKKDKFKYKAFISYSARDRKFADWLFHQLETYRVPGKVRGTAGRDGPVPARLYPIFKDREELPASEDLGKQLELALEDSACLVVICSPRSATSRFVNQEILTFKRMGRDNRILAIIIDGEPNAADKSGVAPEEECFPPALRYRLGWDGALTAERVEPIAADAREQGDGKFNAKLKVVAGILGISYDALKRREDARRLRRLVAGASAAAMIFGAAAFYGWEEWDSGYLNVESNAANSVITVDGRLQLGSPVKGLKLRSGTHELQAEAPEHLGFRRLVDVRQQGRATSRFLLEEGFNWTYARPAIQGGLVLIPTDDDTIIAHNELDRVVFLSSNTGETVAAIPTPNGNTRAFLDLDLGGSAGRVIISAYDAEQTGPEVLAIKAAPSPKTAWVWHGPASGAGKPDSLAVIAAPLSSGKRTIAVAGRDGHIYLLDGESGALIQDITFSPAALPSPPMLAAVISEGSHRIAVFFRQPAAGAGANFALHGALMDLAGGRTVWRKEFGAQWQGPIRPISESGLLLTVIWNASEWKAIDLLSGAIPSGGKLPGGIIGGPGLANLGTKQSPHLIFQFAEPELPMEAVSLENGKPFWKGPKGLSSRQQLRGPGVNIPRTPNGHLLINLQDDLAAVDASDGHVLWKVLGHALRVLLADWNGEGKDKILVGMAGFGLICLDENGRVLWTLKEDRDLAPWALVKSHQGGSASDILVHKHASAIASVHGPHMLWEQHAAAALQATPVIANGQDGSAVVVEVADWGDDVWMRAFNGKDGTPRWAARERFWQNRGGTLADLDGDGSVSIVALGRDPKIEKLSLLSYRPDDGKVLRAVPVAIPGWMSCAPAVADFRGRGKKDVAFTSWDDRSIVLAEGRTGQVLWRFQTGAPNMQGIGAGDLDGDGKPDVVAVSFDGFAYGLRGLDGSLLWKTPIAGGGWANPIVANLDPEGPPQVLLVSAQGRLYVLNGRNGEVIWTPDAGGSGKVSGHPVIVENANRKLILAPLGRAGVVAFDWASRQ
ncbi:MAG: PQQ-binding-like beta-propeller repeat protein, partial [Rhodomicrobium sp.]